MVFFSNKLSVYLVLILLCFGVKGISGQVKNNGLPKINNFTKTDYDGGTQNWQIDQDTIGNIYFANNNGLLQFDGNSWQLYKIPNSSNIRSVKYDRTNGRIYVGGYNQFGYFESNLKGKLVFKSLLPLIDSTESKPTDFIWKIHIFNDEVIFQAFHKAYIFKDNEIKTLEAPKRFQFSFLVDNNLYFQDIEYGVFEYVKGALIALKGTEVLKNTEIWSILKMPNNTLLFTLLEKGLYTYQNEIVKPWNTEANEFVKKNSTLGGITINNTSLVFNTVLDGIIICNMDGKIKQHINLDKGLQNNTILSSFIDSNSNLWLGLDNGITHVSINSPFTYFGSSQNLSTVYGTVIYKGYLYVATNQGLFYRLLNNTFSDDSFKLVEGTTAQTWNIQVIGDDLVCANNRGAMLIKNNKVAKVLDNIGYYGFKEIPDQRNLIIGSNYGGFSIFEKTKTGLVYKNQIGDFDKASNIFEHDGNFLWLKRDNLLYQMEISEDYKEFNSIETITKFNDTVSAINSLQRINNEVYFQTNNHFYSYSKGQDRFFEDRKLSNYFKDVATINNLIEDARGNLWYVFDESLGVLMKNKNRDYTNIIKPFSNLTGNLVPNYLSINAKDNKNIFIGLIDGLAHYDTTVSNRISVPRAVIRSFIYEKDTIMQGNPQQSSFNIKIPYKSNNIKFTFSSPEYNREPILYSYKLDPFDKEWSLWTKNAMKEYTNLVENDYQMHVRVKNSYNNVSDPTLFKFRIYPPWYRHYLAYICYSLFIIVSIYFISLWMKLKIRKDKYYETLEHRKRYLEKEAKIISEQYKLEKEIEDLNRDKLQTRILAKDKELVSNSLQVVKKNKILNGIIDKLKKLETSEISPETKLQLHSLKKSVLKEINADKSWKDLEKHIKNVHFDFLKRLQDKYENITPRELDLSTYLLINMSTKEIAEVMNISKGGVELARYRLRKKLGLSRKDNLTGFLMNI
ncbi:triple tyrosine motif-containing protein [Aureibaculum luteum]|uniref:triple tyrosine motif-containing protein n=1 Tax=Aureibaculum luteum TaxID=1548456 RepID=UPI000E4DB338|nr:triple tyrosine motif-containing protein [Aureibaculum luteum]